MVCQVSYDSRRRANRTEKATATTTMPAAIIPVSTLIMAASRVISVHTERCSSRE